MKPQPDKLLFLSLLFTIFLLDFCSIAKSDLASDRIVLLALRKALGGRSMLRNFLEDRPCNWTGVTCQANRVVELRIPSMGLFGPIPAEIGNLVSLRSLYLQGNFFYGKIPEFLFNLRNLVILNLANNNFTGPISPNFNKLARLTALCLEGNQLNGSIPILNLGSLDQFNVSFNKLTGPIPEVLSSKPASSFEGNSLCGKPLLYCNGSSNGDSNKLSGGAIAGVVIGCFIGCLCRRKKIKQGGVKAVKDPNLSEEEEEEEEEISVEEGVADIDDSTTEYGGRPALGVAKGNSSLDFDLDDLLRASAEVLGKGVFGTSYKATLETETIMVVKRLRDFNGSEKKFREMVKVIEEINHENLLPLTAYYYSKDEKLLVYEYMPMGSLSSLLHGNRSDGRSPLNWDTRIGIALGAAKAIVHLHSLDPEMSHGNIKSSNILLTTGFEVRVSEYGLANAAGPTRINGYLAPEVMDTGTVSQKADVYSFGILLLEVLTGKVPTDSHLKDEGLDLSRWMLSAVTEEWTSGVFDVELLEHINVEVLLRFLELAFSCTATNPDNRPSMAQVRIQMLDLCSLVHETSVHVEDA